MESYAKLFRSIRNRNRIRSSDLIERMVDDFVRFDSPDTALITGTGVISGRPVRIFAQQKPKGGSYQEAAAVNFGMMSATGYWYLVEELEKEKGQGRTVVTMIDTPGADPSKRGSRNLLAWAISTSIVKFLSFPGPVLSVIIGEGGSGGALALQVADCRLIVSDAIYSAISPESCSAILYRDGQHIAEAMQVLRPAPVEVRLSGVVDEVVDWPEEVALNQHDRAADILKTRLAAALEKVIAIPEQARLRRRHNLIFSCGAVRDSALEHTTRITPIRPYREPAARSGSVGSEKQAPHIKPGMPASLSDPAAGVHMCRAPGCHSAFTAGEREEAGWSCPACDGGRLRSEQWIDLLCDPGTFEELYPHLDLGDLHHGGYDTEAYRELRDNARIRHGVNESLRVGIADLHSQRCAVAISDFNFMAGTLGAVAGEKIRLLCKLAGKHGLPLLAVTSSGGVRMQEGTLGLAQMAKSNAAVLDLLRKGIPYISILADPCTGGALGSYATMAPIILAEPGALLAFAGPRVMKLAGFAVKEDNMKSEKLAEFGGVDQVVRREHLKRTAGYYFCGLSQKLAGGFSQPSRKYDCLNPHLSIYNKFQVQKSLN